MRELEKKKKIVYDYKIVDKDKLRRIKEIQTDHKTKLQQRLATAKSQEAAWNTKYPTRKPLYEILDKRYSDQMALKRSEAIKKHRMEHSPLRTKDYV